MGLRAHFSCVVTEESPVSQPTAGNFGVTATRLRGAVYAPVANAKFGCNWADLPVNEIPQKACTMLMMLLVSGTTGTVRGGGKVAHIDPS